MKARVCSDEGTFVMEGGGNQYVRRARAGCPLPQVFWGSSPVRPQTLKRFAPPRSPSSPSPSSGPGVLSNPRLVPVMLSALNEPPGMNSAKSVSLRPNELFAEWSVDDLGW